MRDLKLVRMWVNLRAIAEGTLEEDRDEVHLIALMHPSAETLQWKPGELRDQSLNLRVL